MADLEKLKEAMGELDEESVLKILKEVMAEGGNDAQKAIEMCQQGMDIIGQHFETGEYFVGDLMFAGELMSEAAAILNPALTQNKGDGLGKLLICTVEGDIHDIGKNIVKNMLSAAGFEIIDLGIDIKPEEIVEAAKNEGVKIIGLSGVLTLAANSMKKTIDALKNAGLRDDVKIIIGGSMANDNSCEMVGADAWAINPQKAISICRQWAKA